MLCAEISESRIATKARPVGERSRFRMASVREHGDDQAEEVERLGRVDAPAEQLRRLDVHAGVAAGHALPAREHLLDDEAEGERRDAEVDALHAQRRQADDDADGGREQRRRGQRERERARPCCVEHGLRVGADAEEGRMADARTGR